MRIHPAALLALALAASPHARAAESTNTCKGFVDTLPATLTTQGIWCLRADLATGLASGAAITIANHNITLDCNGFKIGGLAAGAGTRTTGIFADMRNNLALRNCHVRGFETGANLQGTQGSVVEDNRFEGNTVNGLIVGGGLSTVRRNLIIDTGGTTHPDDTGAAYGLRSYGPVDVRDNLIDGVAHPAFSIGILVEGLGVVVENNRVGGLAGAGQGISVNGGQRNVFRRNILIGPGVYGLFCPGASFHVATENVVSGFQYSHFGCPAGGDLVN